MERIVEQQAVSTSPQLNGIASSTQSSCPRWSASQAAWLVFTRADRASGRAMLRAAGAARGEQERAMVGITPSLGRRRGWPSLAPCRPTLGFAQDAPSLFCDVEPNGVSGRRARVRSDKRYPKQHLELTQAGRQGRLGDKQLSAARPK